MQVTLIKSTSKKTTERTHRIGSKEALMALAMPFLAKTPKSKKPIVTVANTFGKFTHLPNIDGAGENSSHILQIFISEQITKHARHALPFELSLTFADDGSFNRTIAFDFVNDDEMQHAHEVNYGFHWGYCE